MRVSIITLTTDASRYVHETLDSVAHSKGLDIEQIVVHDGNDSFANALKHRYPQLRMIKGEGAGATAAGLRGVEAATGDFILFLHSDDRLVKGAIDQLAISAKAKPEIRIWTGGCRIFTQQPDGREVTIRMAVSPDVTRLSLMNICDDLPMFSARFCHRLVYEQIGNLDSSFSESSDREFLIRAALAGIAEAPLGVLVSEIRLHEASRTVHNRRGWVPPYLVEHIRIADMWLARPEIQGGARRFLKNWRAREGLRLVVASARAEGWESAREILRCRDVLNPLWYLRLSTAILARRRRRRGAANNAHGAGGGSTKVDA